MTIVTNFSKDSYIIRQLNGQLIKTIFSQNNYYYSKRGTFSDFSPSIKLLRRYKHFVYNTLLIKMATVMSRHHFKC